MDTQKQIEDLLNKIETDIKQSQFNTGIKASGKSANSLRYAANSSQGVLWGAGYFYQQEHGRKNGKFPPIQPIYEWLGLKKYGLTYKDDKERKSLAFAIAKNMQKKGTWIYRGKSKGLEITKIINKQVSLFKESLTEQQNKEFIVKIKNAIAKK